MLGQRVSKIERPRSKGNEAGPAAGPSWPLLSIVPGIARFLELSAWKAAEPAPSLPSRAPAEM